MLNVEQIPVGPYQANAYVLWDPESAPGETALVDAGAEAERLLAALAARGPKVTAILQTHAHGDHIAALDDVVAATGAPVFLHPDAEPMLRSAEENLSAFVGVPIEARAEVRPVRGGDEVPVLGRKARVLETPGHAAGSVSWHFPDDGVVFTGDALFAGSIGRTDFPGGSLGILLGGIRDRLLTLPDETIVYSGHMGPTTIGRERSGNPFLQHFDSGDAR